MVAQRLVPPQLGYVGDQRRKQIAASVLQEVQHDGAENPMIENVLLMALLMALGVGLTGAVLFGFIYWMEFQND
jgi:nitrate reductase NapE component